MLLERGYRAFSRNKGTQSRRRSSVEVDVFELLQYKLSSTKFVLLIQEIVGG